MAYGFAVIEGLSMIPTYQPGDRVLVKYGSTYTIGDIVLIDFKERIDIKRVVKIEDDRVFVEGDNSAVSIDSRQYGAVKNSRVMAKVLFRIPKILTRN
jgi:phage repressor protein C with HTH and peptisase S24 domain